jgi:type IV secretion system protein VirB1
MKKAQLAIATLMISATENLAYAENLLIGKDMDFINLAQACAPLVAPQTMAAIVKTESQFQPLAIGINNRAQLAHQPKSKEEAIITATSLLAKGYNIDMGLGQVNSANLIKTGLSVEDAFEPCKNLAAAAKILHSNYQAASRKVEGEQPTLYAALSAYNTGSFTKGFKNGYVQKVLNNAALATTNQVVPAIVTIPLTETNAAKPAVKLQAQPNKEAVKLTVERESEVSPQEISNVYTNKADNVMVY